MVGPATVDPSPQIAVTASLVGEEAEPASSALATIEVLVPEASPSPTGETARTEVVPRPSGPAKASSTGTFLALVRLEEDPHVWGGPPLVFAD